jgi:bifunctional DNA-binding transcriptional regulator/antitoxin component of YhaV-PrlF toxin-antitoxin module
MARRISATITDEDALPLPAEVCQRLGLEKGSTVTFLLEDDGVVLLPAPRSIDHLFGSIPALPRTSDDFDEEIEEAIELALRDYDR